MAFEMRLDDALSQPRKNLPGLLLPVLVLARRGSLGEIGREGSGSKPGRGGLEGVEAGFSLGRSLVGEVLTGVCL